MSDAKAETPRGRPEIGRIVLAHEAPLSLAGLSVEPALRRVSWPGGEAILQPRVMQVLVALGRAQGAILTRDELQEACWHGVVVGEDALNRVTGQLRRLCGETGDALKLETIPRVGYRLVTGDLSAAAVAARPASPGAGPVVAVLPFDNLSGDPDFLYFSDGLSDEILQTVARSTGLTVLGRASSFQFRGAGKSARQVGQALGATHVLDGAVRRSGDAVRVTAELVSCATQTQVWSDSFHRQLADIFALQDEIAAKVAVALKATFAPSPATGPIDPEAYDLYLRAHDVGFENVNFDADLLERAVAIAPDFAQAWALLAFARSIGYRWIGRDHGETIRGRAIEAARRALALDPSAAYAYLAQDIVLPICGAFAERLAIVDRALAATPNDPIVLVHAGGLRDVLGYQRRAYEHIERAYRLDPRYAAFYYPYALEGIGRLADARAAITRDSARWPDFAMLKAAAIRFAYESGDQAAYARLMATVRSEDITAFMAPYLAQMAQIHLDWSPKLGAEILAAHWKSLETSGVIPISKLGPLAARGLIEEVFELVEAASFDHLHTPYGQMVTGEVSLNILYTAPFAALRRDPRFVRLCAKLGLAQHWATADDWPDFEAEVAPHYDLRRETRRILG